MDAKDIVGVFIKAIEYVINDAKKDFGFKGADKNEYKRWKEAKEVLNRCVRCGAEFSAHTEEREMYLCGGILRNMAQKYMCKDCLKKFIDLGII